VQAVLAHLHGQDRTLASLDAGDLSALGLTLCAEDLRAALDPAAFVARRTTPGGPAPAVMRPALQAARQRLGSDLDRHSVQTARFVDARAWLQGPPPVESASRASF
jgi:argininosuccinate lyase